jgi:GNAT superfamily N-acetyltransferase
MITIRPLTEQDLPGLVALYGELYPVPTDPDRMRENFRQMASNPDYRVIGAFSDQGELVGSALAVICLDILAGCQPWAMVENVIVTDRVRGQGVGRLLLNELEQFARQRGCSYIQLTTSRPSAYGFYTSVGYSGDLVKAFRKRLQQHERTV